MNNSLNDVVIIEAVRTPIGAYKGSLKELSADKLGSIVIREILRKEDIINLQLFVFSPSREEEVLPPSIPK